MPKALDPQLIRAFLREIENGATVKRAAKNAGISFQGHYLRAKKDPAYREAAEQAQRVAAARCVTPVRESKSEARGNEKYRSEERMPWPDWYFGEEIRRRPMRFDE